MIPDDDNADGISYRLVSRLKALEGVLSGNAGGCSWVDICSWWR